MQKFSKPLVSSSAAKATMIKVQRNLTHIVLGINKMLITIENRCDEALVQKVLVWQLLKDLILWINMLKA